MLWAFDLMQLNGNDLRAVHLEERKRRLGHLIGQSAIACLLHYDTFDDGERLLAECEKRGIEGVVAKHRASIYRSGRSASFSMKANVSRSLCDEAMSKTGRLWNRSCRATTKMAPRPSAGALASKSCHFQLARDIETGPLALHSRHR